MFLFHYKILGSHIQQMSMLLHILEAAPSQRTVHALQVFCNHYSPQKEKMVSDSRFANDAIASILVNNYIALPGTFRRAVVQINLTQLSRLVHAMINFFEIFELLSKFRTGSPAATRPMDSLPEDQIPTVVALATHTAALLARNGNLTPVLFVAHPYFLEAARQKLIALGIMTRLFDLMQSHHNSTLIIEHAMFALGNLVLHRTLHISSALSCPAMLTSGEGIAAILRYNGIQIILDCIRQHRTNSKIVERAYFALANMSDQSTLPKFGPPNDNL